MIKDIYILHVAGRLAFYLHSKTCPSYGFAPQEKFIDFIKGLREDYPDHRLRCIRNKGIEDWLEKRLIQQQQMIKNKLENNY
jgi:hypothetical protein